MRKDFKSIDIQIDIMKLKEAVENCNLGMGTYDSPIAADYFVVGLDLDNDTIDLSKNGRCEISFKVSNKAKKKTISNTPELLDVFIYPSGKGETVLSGHRIRHLFEEIFECEKGSNIYFADRKLCISADNVDKESKISVINRGEKTDGFDLYFSYRILFKLKVLRTLYCFSIDPFFRVRSRRPSN